MQHSPGTVNMTNLNALFIVDPADHLHTHLRDLAEGGLFQADVPQDLDHSLPHADARVLDRVKRDENQMEHHLL